MGIIERFKDIMSANINALLDKCEDPDKMVDQTLRTLKEDLADVKKETAGVMASEKRDLRALDETKNEISTLENAAKNALKANDSEAATKLISQKQNLESKLPGLQQNYNASHANAEKMRQMHDKLTLDIQQLEAKRANIHATIANAKATQHINEMNAGINNVGSISKFEEYEKKAQEMLDKAQSEAELNTGSNSEVEDLKTKYGSGATDQSVSEELERMKLELGL